jgi:uncharacterized protein
MLHIDINVTSICNLACTYCSEGQECGLSSLYLKNTKVNVQDFVDNVKKTEGKRQINFWGGEPLINWDYCKLIIDNLKDDKNISFFFYTNGVLIKDIIDEIKQYNDELPNRFTMQISYDGKYLTDTIRIDKTGKGTSERVVEAYKLLRKNNIRTSLKSVISADGFPHLFNSFKSVYDVQGYYNPTPDLYSSLTPEDFQDSLQILGAELKDIMHYIFDNNLNPDVFSWFRKSRATCSAGASLVGVDLTGDLYPCHGCFYEGRDEYQTGKIEDLNPDKLDKIRDKFRDLNQIQPIECQVCNVNFCMKCQAANLSKSKKETFDEKWVDYQSNWQVCYLFKYVDQFNKTIRHAMREKGVIND